MPPVPTHQACLHQTKDKHSWDRLELPCPLLSLDPSPGLDTVSSLQAPTPFSVLCDSQRHRDVQESENSMALASSLVQGPPQTALDFPVLRLHFPTPGGVPQCFPTAQHPTWWELVQLDSPHSPPQDAVPCGGVRTDYWTHRSVCLSCIWILSHLYKGLACLEIFLPSRTHSFFSSSSPLTPSGWEH